MAEQSYLVAELIVVCGSYLRVLVAAGAAVRTVLSRGRFRRLQMGVVEMLVAVEPLVLAGITSLMLVLHFDLDTASGADAAAAAGGAALVLIGWDLTIWSFLSWRSIFFGHGVQEDQDLVTRGAYGFVRHPVYLGVLLMWLGLTIAFLSPVALIVAAAYVLPFYVLYMLSEERMMTEEFGAAYRQYCQRVPMLLPRLPVVAMRRPGA